MPEKFVIKGKKAISGTIDVKGSKNAATPILAATLLTKEPCVISNLPLIEDIFRMIELLKSVGAKVEWLEERKVKIEAREINSYSLNQDLIGKMRSSILLIGPLLARTGGVRICQPGGCIIGSRPIDTHLRAFEKMGVRVKTEKTKNGKKESVFYSLKTEEGLKPAEIVLSEFSVTATENVLLTASSIKGITTIKIAACEPHVIDLCNFLVKMGVSIEGIGTHTIIIKGREGLEGANHSIVFDYIEAGTFILMAVAAKGRVLVKNVPVSHLDLFFEKLKEAGANLEIGKDWVEVRPARKIKLVKIQALPYPGIPTDLQSLFGVLAIESSGSTLIHDPLYEARLKYLEELNKMGAEIIVCDPHRAVINGPRQLYGTEVGPYDLRGGAALVMAGIIAKGITTINDISSIDRGYEKLEERLSKIGVSITRMK